MDVSVVLTLVQTILQLLESPICKEIQSLWDFKSQLQKLQNTMSVIQAVLTNVERLESQQLPITIPVVTLRRLQDAVYDADDLFDEVATAANLKELMPGNKLSKEVRLFFSRFNQLTYTFTKSHEIRNIRGILDDIAKDHRDFGTLITPSNNAGLSNDDSSRETDSFLCEEDFIIGRENDKRVVINMLLHTSVEEDENVSVVCIVGIGGLGKTTLAKLVYNDDNFQSEQFQKIWVCVSDDFNVTSLLGQILAAATNNTNNNGLNKDQLKTKLQQVLAVKKYFLVLDDVWNEDPMKWDELRNVLIQGESGSKIIVTTRSTEVAKIVASNHQAHELKGLSEEDSWNLFEQMTLGPGQLRMEAHLVEIGKDIVHKCVNVPLALRVIGSLLRGQGDSAWRNLRNTDLAKIKQDDKGGIIPVLKISYHRLPLHLKNCFSYCAVFPKDYKIVKGDLIYQWMAHGFIMPLSEQSLEDLGDIYFDKLLQRCFFQDVVRCEKTGKILSCKMHDLVHDLATEVSGIGNDIGSLQDDKTRHIFIDDTLVKVKDVECYLTKMKRLRTCLVRQQNFTSFDAQFLFKMKYLRVGEIRIRNIKKLPSKIGELLHLRYLDLSHNEKLCMLRDSITQLYNLQTLKLYGCSGLKELPRKLSKLVNLRHLDIDGCYALTHMPGGMNRMACLHKLTRFILGDVTEKAGDVGKLEDIKYLNNLRDYMQIEMKDGWTYDDAEKVKEGRYLINKSLLNTIHIQWNYREASSNDGKVAEALLQGLQPHPNIQELRLVDYPGVGFPRWGMNFAESLPKLVYITLFDCTRLESVPLLSQLRHLKVLKLKSLTKLEYVESRGESGDNELVFFPSLTELDLRDLPELKSLPLLSQLRHLKVLVLKSLTKLEYVESSGRSGDNELVFFPPLTELLLWDLPELKGWWKISTSSSSSSSTSKAGEGGEIGRGDVNHSNNNQNELKLSINGCIKLTNIPGFPNLKALHLNGSSTLLEHLHCLPRESFHHHSRMFIMDDDKMERLSTVEVFTSGRLNSLRSLEIAHCSKLKSIWGRGVWEHFTALETLVLWGLPELDLELEDNDDEMHMPWKWVASTLHSLSLFGLANMVKMPKGIQHLTSLRSLHINSRNFEEIPAWIGCLSSLQQLEIYNCSKVKSLPQEMRHLTCLTHLELQECSTELKERCKDPTGVDWHKIEHVPKLYIR